MNAVAQSPPAEGPVDIEDADRDALHILPLMILPIEHPPLRRARMVKGPQLESMIEFFALSDGTSGQTPVTSAAKVFGYGKQEQHPDLALLRKVADLPSFDVYSLRILLRGLGITVNDKESLRLSETKMKSLAVYMSKFTKPLVAEIFGDDAGDESGGFTDLVGLMRNCPVESIRERLGRMAEKLGIEIPAIPNFLEDYADIFMSLSYYRQCLDQILPPIQTFLECTHDIRSNYQLRQDFNLLRTLDLIEETFNGLTANVTGRLESFERSTNDMWRDLNAQRFRKIETLIKSYHVSIGGVLCALTVKINAWKRLFPSPGSSGPIRRAEFIMSEMRRGIDRIRAIEDSTPMLAELQS